MRDVATPMSLASESCRWRPRIVTGRRAVKNSRVPASAAYRASRRWARNPYRQHLCGTGSGTSDESTHRSLGHLCDIDGSHFVPWRAAPKQLVDGRAERVGDFHQHGQRGIAPDQLAMVDRGTPAALASVSASRGACDADSVRARSRRHGRGCPLNVGPQWPRPHQHEWDNIHRPGQDDATNMGVSQLKPAIGCGRGP
jgi:hypothetical protein